jgi:CHAT domain-containing protein
LLDYYCTSRDVLVFAVDQTQVRVFEQLGSLLNVERMINRWRFNLASTRLAVSNKQVVSPHLLVEAQNILQALHGLLMEPLELDLANYHTLWIVPHRSLWSVPFAALRSDGQYVVEKFELVCLPGFVVLERESETQTPSLTDAPVIVGYSDEGRLARTVDEAQVVADVLGDAEVLLEEQASIERLRDAARSCTLLHLATHGLFRADAPLFSALRLADGWLMAGDLEDWYMPRVKLVTLGACETGVSFSWGNDLLGLARGFMSAGARRLIVSLWAVDDVSTAELMTGFYKKLKLGHGATAALQMAQTAILEKYPHPFYWAGFEIMDVI